MEATSLLLQRHEEARTGQLGLCLIEFLKCEKNLVWPAVTWCHPVGSELDNGNACR